MTQRYERTNPRVEHDIRNGRPKWTVMPPTERGWYWFRQGWCSGDTPPCGCFGCWRCKPEIFEIRIEGGVALTYDGDDWVDAAAYGLTGGEWAGPLLPLE
jgi:hypothetical protein